MRINKLVFLLLFAVLLDPFRCYAAETAVASGDENLWGFEHRDGVVLVLSGGGTKGLSHIGVIEVLERENIPIAAVVGTSMGGIIGGLYAAGYSTEEMHKILNDADLMEIISGRADSAPNTSGHNRPPSSGRSLLTFYADEDFNTVGRRGMLKGKNLYTFVSELTARVSTTDFNLLPIPFAAVACDLENGDTVILREGNLASALRATMSIPFLFEPWEVGGLLLVDGGLKANLPVLDAKSIFPGHPVIAVNLSPEDITRPRKQLNKIVDVSAQILEILMVEQVRANLAVADIVIAPHVSDFGVLDSGGYDKIIERGREAAEEQVPLMRELVAGLGKHDGHLEEGSLAAHQKQMIVTEIHFSGAPVSVAEELYERFEHWVGKPLDMKKVAEEIARLSQREEFLTVDSRTNNITDSTVALTFVIERPPKYEISFTGYASNLHPNRWFSTTLIARDLLSDGDTASFEARISENWGGMLQYFTPLDERDRQFGIMLAAGKENHDTLHIGKFDFERYTGKLVYYMDFGRGIRLGAGYAVSRTSFGNKDTESGPYISFTYNNLDDQIMPSSGFAATTELWYPLDEQLISRTQLTTYLPLMAQQKIVVSAGLTTGDGDNLPYAAMLGGREELYSLSRRPLVGDQAWWIHVGSAYTLMKTWWGGVSVEAFGKYGQVMRNWTNSGSWWEVGLGFSISTNVLPGKLIIVYDQGGEVTFGFSIGIPNFWSGPLP